MTNRVGYLDEAVARYQSALDGGYATAHGPRVEMTLAGGCHAPVTRSKTYRREHKPLDEQRRPNEAVFIDAEVRCRKCPWCLNKRRKLWTVRAMKEVAFAQRTWFGTMTLGPTARQHYLMTARDNAAKRSLSREADFDGYTDMQRFSAVVGLLNADVTRWAKRVRASSGSQLRYLFTVERHRDGTPHLHCLVHECKGSVPVTGRTLGGQWPLGFTQWRLVPLEEGSRAAWYVCKYLAKDALARVRASKSYGEPLRLLKSTVEAPHPTVSTIGPQSVTPYLTYRAGAAARHVRTASELASPATVTGKEVSDG